MLSINKSHLSWQRKMIIFISLLCILFGVYVLITAFSPFFIGQFVNPTDNSTTKLLSANEKSQEKENRLYIPKIDVNVAYAKGNETTLEHGAWWRQPQNGNAKDGGNFVLSAHRFVMGLTPIKTQRQSPFYNIHKLGVGDKLIVDYENVRYTYIIEKIFSVKPSEVNIEERTAEPQLTLYSCTLGGATDGREVIIAKQNTTQ